ncbi:BnaAnng13780D [Brassica napus]|uniref:BnaAnng13780D protein n=1 Tax=Brassica napus TaxID=3708 RepID=A0A078J0H7_BRANA|nr:BnaAnng13780D [Brassica napus]
MSSSAVVGDEPVRHSTFDTIDLPNSLSLGSSILGTSAASRRMENSWESLYFSLMRRYCHLIFDLM